MQGTPTLGIVSFVRCNRSLKKIFSIFKKFQVLIVENWACAALCPLYERQKLSKVKIWPLV
jgi:hypothetical protein